MLGGVAELEKTGGGLTVWVDKLSGGIRSVPGDGLKGNRGDAVDAVEVNDGEWGREADAAREARFTPKA